MTSVMFWLFYFLLTIDLSYAYDYLNGTTRHLSFVLHASAVILSIVLFVLAVKKANRVRQDDYRTWNFWLLTLSLPSVIGYVLMWVAYRLDLIAGYAWMTDMQLVQKGLLFGTLFFIPQVGGIVGWKMLKEMLK